MSAVNVIYLRLGQRFSWFVIGTAFVLVFWDGIIFLIDQWGRPEYSYGYFVPFISIWLAWQKRDKILEISQRGSWMGFILVIAAMLLTVFGDLSTIYLIIHYAMILTIFGVVLATAGWQVMRLLLAPLAFLVFMVPLPPFLYNNLSLKMQLISSTLGVELMRFVNIDVFQDGNVIDLGLYQIQVVEACDGLRYLFPLMTFGYLFAYLYRGPIWQKLFLFFSTLPITIFINSLRLAIMGLLFKYGGAQAAEGFLHLFEGWVIFLLGIGLLFLETRLFLSLTGRTNSARNLVDGEPQRSKTATPRIGSFAVSKPSLGVLLLLVATVITLSTLPNREEVVPQRKILAMFPMNIGNWQGINAAAGVDLSKVIRKLELSDYVLAKYGTPENGPGIDLYIAYYDSQRKGASIHSPRSCLPGGGWEIAELGVATLEGLQSDYGLLNVNRVVIIDNKSKQLVYYWFQQRGYAMTNEYMVKWMIFWDALTRNRTDGALIRIITPIVQGEDLGNADERLASFLRELYPHVSDYIPS